MLADKQLRNTHREGRAGMPAGQLSVRVSSPVARGPEPLLGVSPNEHKVQERVDQWSAAHRVSAMIGTIGAVCQDLCCHSFGTVWDIQRGAEHCSTCEELQAAIYVIHCTQQA
jgi:hypothetical protein